MSANIFSRVGAVMTSTCPMRINRVTPTGGRIYSGSKTSPMKHLVAEMSARELSGGVGFTPVIFDPNSTFFLHYGG